MTIVSPLLENTSWLLCCIHWLSIEIVSWSAIIGKYTSSKFPTQHVEHPLGSAGLAVVLVVALQDPRPVTAVMTLEPVG